MVFDLAQGLAPEETTHMANWMEAWLHQTWTKRQTCMEGMYWHLEKMVMQKTARFQTWCSQVVKETTSKMEHQMAKKVACKKTLALAYWMETRLQESWQKNQMECLSR